MQDRVEHAMTAPPTLVLTPARRGWAIECTCGWESETFDDRLAADAAGHQHLSNPRPARQGLFARRTPTRN